ncbi:Phenylalanine--tRNA ligase beta subunit [Corynebacterium ciconiae DSM 44920]|uniref:phenylalanine--tRNA ligase subunit beta n=1 Tax=Corynebacterium ciconiae TaxID=227319 RepID=UPI0003815B38|nr:phenylalanine--tRNA ligase subunit beta [Corynebacterium ciconiae]WKD61100.1 Phenylalanine--tRNA ligase beta subunit [Corynebacterium ciconiae DSM 44920]
MFISQNWITRLLRAYAEQPDFSIESEQLDAAFVRVGFETEGYAPLPEITGPLVIGRVESIEELTGFKKPIRFCHVNVGEANGTGQLQEIVCGARNFSEGSYVVVSLPGTVLPGGFEIAARKTYDHVSAGMICSAMELGLTEKQNPGIITLPAGVAEPGEDARPVLGLDDTVFEVNITPDRGYALSARGLSREIASSLNMPFVDPAADPAVAGIDIEVPEVNGSVINVDVQPETKARRFGLRAVRGIDPSVPTPFWMQRELMLCGQRPVNLATDVTNYVMLLLGTPMHAFDASLIQGDLVVRRATEGESLITLDHVERTLHSEDVVICDDNGVQSLAGVMGGSSSEVNENSTDIYLEAAIWDQITVARTSRRHKLSSEASRRFERGVDPNLVEAALDMAASLLARLGGGDVAAERTLVEVAEQEPVTVMMDVDFPSRYAGVNYEESVVVARLEEVGCVVARQNTTLAVTPPSWRPDITMDVDLVEEILRLEGLESIPSIVPTAPAGTGLTPAQRRRRAIGHALAYSGYAEILPTPFMETSILDQWGLDAEDDRRAVVTVQNPLESDHSVLGTTLLPAMLDAVKRNVARGHASVALFGQEQVAFKRADHSPMPSTAERPGEEEIEELRSSLPYQPLHVATVACGHKVFEGPWGEGRAYTYADAIESARIVAAAAGVELELANAEQLPWHPGRCAELRVHNTVVGYAGEMHPQVCKDTGLPPRTCAMELDVTSLPLEENFPAPVLSAYPALLQDVALVVDEDIPAETVRTVVAQGAGELLEHVELFDIYRSDALGEGKKSLAFALRFRASDRTLTDEECNAARMAAVDLAKEKLDAAIRA